jgi:hypothetical protein
MNFLFSKKKLFAGLALTLALAGSVQAASYAACATPLTADEMQEIRGEGQIVIRGWVYQWTSTATFYLVVQTPHGPMQVPASVAVNAYYLAQTFTSILPVSYPISRNYYEHTYRGGSLDGRKFGGRQTNVPYYHVVNGWPVGGI